MPYVYHMRSPDMIGDILYPLNELKNIYPQLYERQIAKYFDHASRVNLPAQVIPKLECLWNDVIQCAPIHPYYIFEALQSRGLNANPTTEFYQIEVNALRDLPVVVFDNSKSSDSSSPIDPAWIDWFDASTYQELTALPSKTLAWYDKLRLEGRTYGHFLGIPHIMVQGRLAVDYARRVCWSESVL